MELVLRTFWINLLLVDIILHFHHPILSISYLFPPTASEEFGNFRGWLAKGRERSTVRIKNCTLDRMQEQPFYSTKSTNLIILSG